MTFDLGSARLFCTSIFETYFSYCINILIVATDSYHSYMYFNLVVLSPLAANASTDIFYSFMTFGLLIITVILLLNSLF